MRFLRIFFLTIATLLAAHQSWAATGALVPNGEQTFTDSNGNPLASGYVYMYVPGTTTPKNTWQDINLTVLNTNPVRLDSSGRAIIWGASGNSQYRQVVQDQDGNLIWDQITSTDAGNVVGPASSTVNEFALWNNTTGTLLKDGLNVNAQHTGGLKTTDTTSPNSFVAQPTFGDAWVATNLFQLTETGTHAGVLHGTLGIVHNAIGSGTNGPANLDAGIILGCNKTNYLTSSVAGEINCVYNYVTQGSNGDAAATLSDVSKVDDYLVPNYGAIGYEGVTRFLLPTSGTTRTIVHTLTNWGITGFQDVLGVAAGVGGACRLTVTDTSQFDVLVASTVYGIGGAYECNGTWTFTIIDATHVDLVGTVLSHAYTSGGVFGNPTHGLGGPTFGIEARADTGQNGVGVLISTAIPGNTGVWGSAIRVRGPNDSNVVFDMDAQSGRFVVQPAGNTQYDPNYSATFLNGPIRWAGNTTVMPRDNPNTYSTGFPGGGALGFNHSSAGEVDLWNLLTTASVSFEIWQKTAAAAETLVALFGTSGTNIYSPVGLQEGVTVGSPTGGYKGNGTINFSSTLWSDGVQGIASCSVVTAGATITIKNGIITAFTGC